MKPKTPQTRYVVAVLSMVLATGVLAFGPALSIQSPYLILLIAVAASTYFAGVGPGLVSTLLGCLVAISFFVSPDLIFGFHRLPDWIGMGMYLFCSASLVWIVERQNGEMARARSDAQSAELRLHEALKEMSDRTRTEMAEARASALLDTFFESAPVGLGFLDPELRFVRVNRTLAALNGKPISQHIGRAWLEVWPQIPTQMEEALLSVIATSRAIVNLEIQAFADAEEQIPLTWNVSCYPIQLDGETAGVGAVCEDLTERKRREEAVRQSQKTESLAILAGGVAHDFNNILTAILGHASLLTSRFAIDSPEFRSARVIVQSSERAAELTQQMLAYSGRGRFAFAPLDLGREIIATRGLLEAALPRRTHLELDIPGHIPLVEADPSQIYQLVCNLLTNASEAMDAKYGQMQHQVRLSLNLESIAVAPLGRAPTSSHLEPGQYVVLRVRDEGAGMDEGTQARIFDPFFSTKFTGRGLGLSAVLGIVRAHQGAIHVESQPGEGSQFTCYFPLAEPFTSEEPVMQAAYQEPHFAPTVLVVDNQTEVLEANRMALESKGFRVLVATSTHEAIRLFRTEADICVVLLDMTTPEVDGDETLRQLRLTRASIPVVRSSGLPEVEARESFGDGLGGFLQKPYTPDVLLSAIESALSTRARSA